MSLSHLTTFGWIWFGATLVITLSFLFMCLRWNDREMGIWPFVHALMIAVLIWLVTP